MKAFFRLMLSDMRKLFNIKTVLISAAAFILAVAVLARNGAGDSFVIYVTGGFCPRSRTICSSLWRRWRSIQG